MPMDQAWFELRDIRRRELATAVWIALRANGTVEEIGEFGRIGHREEYHGATSIMVPRANKPHVEELGWMEIGMRSGHAGRVEDGEYIPSDLFTDYSVEFTGIYPILVDRGNAEIGAEWHLHQDFVVTLGLRREGDSWVRPEEGFLEVAKLERDTVGHPCRLDVRASHLRDYLCAREMGLYVTSYRSRTEVVESAEQIKWSDNPLREQTAGIEWVGGVTEIHEGGEFFGRKTHVLRVSRTDVDTNEDVPKQPFPSMDEDVVLDARVVSHEGRKLYRVSGELWRNEWLDPASGSPIVRRDKTAATAFFIIDAEGRKAGKDELVGARQWLWFRPGVMTTLAHRRGGSLIWYTRDTGGVACAVGDRVHFGVNNLGLINVYAKDIAQLPDWQQQIWAGFNTSPEGGVSEELLASQAKAQPADTQAPEPFLELELEAINKVAKAKFGTAVLRPNDHVQEILRGAHRFRALDRAGLLALAKDLARLTADSFDTAAIQKLAPPPGRERLSSLKSLEVLLATKVGKDTARSTMSPLVWVYDLRLADAHLPSEKTDEALKLLGIDAAAPFVTQGYQLLDACVGGLEAIRGALDT